MFPIKALCFKSFRRLQVLRERRDVELGFVGLATIKWGRDPQFETRELNLTAVCQ